MIEDELLKWRFRRGSREALARIYEKYVHLLLSIAMGLLNDPQEAEDVVQDVFVTFAQDAAGFSLHGSLKAYLATCVVNRVRDRVRSERVRRRHTSDCDATPLEAEDLERSLLYSERCERLSRALAELPYEQREVVILKVKDGLKLREIARLQNTSISTVHGRYRYGMDRLRTLLNGEI